MSPELMTAYLRAARAAGALQFTVSLPDGGHLGATLGPPLEEDSPDPGYRLPEPGGWKVAPAPMPEGLDEIPDEDQLP